MARFVRSATIVLTLAFLSACAASPEDTGATAGAGESLSTGVSANAGGSTGAYAPGSAAEFQATVGDRVYFGLDRHDLSAESQALLARQAQWLKTWPDRQLVIEGHADERGTREYNLALGERRATAVRDYLSAQGIPAARLSTVSFGKERPTCVEADEACWSQNRRGVSVVE
ncbi:peptidoglycan-associated lipoprotein Pal [Caenispirillum salinarum]|nr:peptidoglycan-associated lipoprotein Pal [Caenispirillum salinarum]